MLKNLDDTVHFHCKKREEWIQEATGETLHEVVVGSFGQFIDCAILWEK